MTIAPVVVGVMWRLILDSGVGVADPLFQLLGLSAPEMLAHNGTAFIAVVMVNVWEWTPLIFLILFRGLHALRRSRSRRRCVDGAGRSTSTTRCRCSRPSCWSRSSFSTIDAIGLFDQIYV